MTLPIDFREPARAEFDAAADWYEQRLSGLGAAFTSAVDRLLERIASQPDFYPPVWQDVREALVQGFPYCVYYRQEARRVVVLAVFHTARNPAVWRGRS